MEAVFGYTGVVYVVSDDVSLIVKNGSHWPLHCGDSFRASQQRPELT